MAINRCIFYGFFYLISGIAVKDLYQRAIVAGTVSICPKRQEDGMDHVQGKPELSIIVPVLNEAGIVRGFLRNLAGQEGVDFEVVVCDGGSTDGTLEIVREAGGNSSFPLRIVAGKRGRGRQMNEGAAAANGNHFLFLHADSCFRDVHALRKALDTLAIAIKTIGHERVAGRFALRFRSRDKNAPFLYYFHENKARLDRAECIHGDQGFLMRGSFFNSVGAFEESVPVQEDTRFAERVRRVGKWILFPAEIVTSARRFETEGVVEREILNLLIMSLSAVGREGILREMPRIYSSQDRAHRLRLFPFFHAIREMVGNLPLRERMSFWYSCGAYALGNSWQPAFVLDVRRHYRRGIPPGKGELDCLEYFDRHILPATRNKCLKVCASLLVWVWFHAMLVGRYWWEKNGKTYR